MMNNDLKKTGRNDLGIWDDVPLRMQLRKLQPDGSTRIDSSRTIQDDEPFFVTGEAYVSLTGAIVLVQVIPSDGYPGWVELGEIAVQHEPGSSNDLASDRLRAWFTQREETKKSSVRVNSDEVEPKRGFF
jgi:hypothetical protein